MLYTDRAWLALSRPGSSGTVQVRPRLDGPNTDSTVVSWPGSANTAPLQYGVTFNGTLYRGVSPPPFCQNVEVGSRGATIPVTASVIGPDDAVSTSRDPGCRPYRAAVAVETVQAMVLAWIGPVMVPAVSRPWLASSGRPRTAIRAALPVLVRGPAPDARV